MENEPIAALRRIGVPIRIAVGIRDKSRLDARDLARRKPVAPVEDSAIENCDRRTKPMRALMSTTRSANSSPFISGKNAVNPRPRALAWLFKHIHTRRLRSGADPTWLMITFANQDDLK